MMMESDVGLEVVEEEVCRFGCEHRGEESDVID